MRPKGVLSLIVESGREWSRDDCPRMAAALAFYAILSLPPVMVIAVAVAGLAFGEEAARGELAAQIRGLIGERGADLVQTILASVRAPGESVPAMIAGIVTLLLGATGVFSELKDALDAIWEVKSHPKKTHKWLRYLRDRALAFSMVLAVGFLLMVSLLVSAAVNGLTKRLGTAGDLLSIANALVLFGLEALLFAAIFKVLPDRKLRWKNVWFGAVVTAFLFAVGRYLIGLYLGRATIGTVYGAAGSFIVFLLWVYYSSLLLLFGAEMTEVYTRRRERPPPPPKSHAEPETVGAAGRERL